MPLTAVKAVEGFEPEAYLSTASQATTGYGRIQGGQATHSPAALRLSTQLDEALALIPAPQRAAVLAAALVRELTTANHFQSTNEVLDVAEAANELRVSAWQ